MKSFIWTCLLFLAFGLALAGPMSTVTKKATVLSNSVTLEVDVDYSWDAHCKALKFGTPEFKQARLECMAYADAVHLAQKYSKEGKYQEAEEEAPLNVMKAFYGLANLREIMGGTKTDGVFGGYPVDGDGKYAGDSEKDIRAQYLKVRGYIDAATKNKRTVDSKGNDVSYVSKVLDGYADGILSDAVE